MLFLITLRWINLLHNECGTGKGMILSPARGGTPKVCKAVYNMIAATHPPLMQHQPHQHHHQGRSMPQPPQQPRPTHNSPSSQPSLILINYLLPHIIIHEPRPAFLIREPRTPAINTGPDVPLNLLEPALRLERFLLV